ncbi:NAD(P)H-binding protein [Rhodanobacter sp. DHB23]|uniref:NAD(P)H-binding protein n=1 Tax=Rhodanobacter sp. DHB23 TaxID=2775923 RepID=UPI001784E959|nr:NAD(P)H-binding protein [Rhodanobacter sp. DHB23]MBD8871580.1 NAD(P)H-binding protein [Rhodanobacter sp. DHB23]
MNTTHTALIIGATGGAGGEIAAALLRRGWTVRALVRNVARPGLDPRIDWREGDALQADDVMQAAAGVDVLVHAVNPPGYRDWDTLVLPMLDNSLAAARANAARLVLPGTVYNYGPDAFPLLAEGAPQQPLTRKGAIRVAMERRLAEAADVRSLVLRCGDFFGPRAGNNWFAAMIKPGRPARSLLYPGRRGLPHAWAYLPDVGETVARLLEREGGLERHARFHFAGHHVDAAALLAAVRRATGNATLPLRAFPWWLTWLAAPFVVVLRELREMRYLWREPLQLDNRRLLACLGEEPHTPLDQAVETTLRGFGCVA